MRLTIDQPMLAALLKRAAQVADGRAALPLFGVVQFDLDNDHLEVIAANNLYTLISSMPVSTLAYEPGQCAVDAVRLSGLAEALHPKKPVELVKNLGSSRLTITSGRTRASVPAIDPLDLPKYVDRFPAPQIHVEAKELRRALGFLAPAMGREITRPQFWGVTLNFDPHDGGAAIAAAADGTLGAVYRLNATGDTFPAAIIPRPLCRQLRALLKDLDCPVGIVITEHAIRLSFGCYTVIGKLVDAEPFPHYRWMPAPSDWPIFIDRAELDAAARRVGAAADPDRQGKRAAVLTFKQQELQLCDQQRLVEDTIPASWGNEDREPIGVNTQHLLTSLEAVGGGEVELHIESPSRPIRVCAKGDVAHAYVTAPYRIAVAP